jgi:hypothetical protein
VLLIGLCVCGYVDIKGSEKFTSFVFRDGPSSAGIMI